MKWAGQSAHPCDTSVLMKKSLVKLSSTKQQNMLISLRRITIIEILRLEAIAGSSKARKLE
jgi:hypothetical protein